MPLINLFCNGPLGLDILLKQADDKPLLPLQFDQGQLSTCLTANSFWVIYSFGSRGELAIRTCFDSQTMQDVRLAEQTETALVYQLVGSLRSADRTGGSGVCHPEWPHGGVNRCVDTRSGERGLFPESDRPQSVLPDARTDPAGSVAAKWPELGFALPAAGQPLVAGTKVVLSAAPDYPCCSVLR